MGVFSSVVLSGRKDLSNLSKNSARVQANKVKMRTKDFCLRVS